MRKLEHYFICKTGMQEVKLSPPYPLLWLRYSTFIVLYPLGVASELTMGWLARPTIKDARPLSVRLPNAANFAFDYYWACWIIAALYIPGVQTKGKIKRAHFAAHVPCSLPVSMHHMLLTLALLSTINTLCMQIWMCSGAACVIANKLEPDVQTWHCTRLNHEDRSMTTAMSEHPLTANAHMQGCHSCTSTC